VKIVFIIGTGRCGSSFVHELIAAHRDAGFISNVEDRLRRLPFKGRYNNLLYRLSQGRFTTKGKARFAPSEAFDLIGRRASPIYCRPARDLRADDVTPWLEQRFRALFEERHALQGKAVFTHKYTGWSRIGFFARIFPEARFIHVIRDGRAVANSWLHMPWWGGYAGPENWPWGVLPVHYQREWEAGDRSFTLLAGIGWKLLMDSYEQSARGLDESRYMSFRYEDFLARPHATMEACLRFAGLPWTAQFERHLARQRIRPERGDAWRRELLPGQIAELDASLAGKLVSYRYAAAAAAGAGVGTGRQTAAGERVARTGASG